MSHKELLNFRYKIFKSIKEEPEYKFTSHFVRPTEQYRSKLNTINLTEEWMKADGNGAEPNLKIQNGVFSMKIPKTGNYLLEAAGNGSSVFQVNNQVRYLVTILNRNTLSTNKHGKFFFQFTTRMSLNFPMRRRNITFIISLSI